MEYPSHDRHHATRRELIISNALYSCKKDDVTLIVQATRPRVLPVKQFVQSHTAGKSQNQDFNQVSLAPKSDSITPLTLLPTPHPLTLIP